MPIGDNKGQTERRAPGAWKGRVRIADDFHAPLPADIAEAFGDVGPAAEDPCAPPSTP